MHSFGHDEEWSFIFSGLRTKIVEHCEESPFYFPHNEILSKISDIRQHFFQEFLSVLRANWSGLTNDLYLEQWNELYLKSSLTSHLVDLWLISCCSICQGIFHRANGFIKAVDCHLKDVFLFNQSNLFRSRKMKKNSTWKRFHWDRSIVSSIDCFSENKSSDWTIDMIKRSLWRSLIGMKRFSYHSPFDSWTVLCFLQSTGFTSPWSVFFIDIIDLRKILLWITEFAAWKVHWFDDESSSWNHRVENPCLIEQIWANNDNVNLSRHAKMFRWRFSLEEANDRLKPMVTKREKSFFYYSSSLIRGLKFYWTFFSRTFFIQRLIVSWNDPCRFLFFQLGDTVQQYENENRFKLKRISSRWRFSIRFVERLETTQMNNSYRNTLVFERKQPIELSQYDSTLWAQIYRRILTRDRNIFKRLKSFSFLLKFIQKFMPLTLEMSSKSFFSFDHWKWSPTNKHTQCQEQRKGRKIRIQQRMNSNQWSSKGILLFLSRSIFKSILYPKIRSIITRNSMRRKTTFHFNGFFIDKIDHFAADDCRSSSSR